MRIITEERTIILNQQNVAWGQLHKAISDGLLKRPLNCEKCGSPKIIEAHHNDYEKPLEVQWLCRKCHKGLHKILRDSNKILKQYGWC